MYGLICKPHFLFVALLQSHPASNYGAARSLLPESIVHGFNFALSESLPADGASFCFLCVSLLQECCWPPLRIFTTTPIFFALKILSGVPFTAVLANLFAPVFAKKKKRKEREEKQRSTLNRCHAGVFPTVVHIRRRCQTSRLTARASLESWPRRRYRSPVSSWVFRHPRGRAAGAQGKESQKA